MSEHDHQAAVVRWARMQRTIYPALRLLYAVPNGGARNKVTAWKLKQEGVVSGVPDLCLPAARGPFHGLYVEMKDTRKNARTSKEQREWIDALIVEGYAAEVCVGFDDARETILNYLHLGHFKPWTPPTNN